MHKLGYTLCQYAEKKTFAPTPFHPHKFQTHFRLKYPQHSRSQRHRQPFGKEKRDVVRTTSKLSTKLIPHEKQSTGMHKRESSLPTPFQNGNSDDFKNKKKVTHRKFPISI
ncbi:hypothetical protein [Neisseria gonorrhoeae]|uniref:hypothetical protein n=1 Tax=Neisseria gonorrhoeae TaxID=485 RepID=UPI0018A2E843|nr:hypothetical protein [Neisseria gonorrhoeae]